MQKNLLKMNANAVNRAADAVKTFIVFNQHLFMQMNTSNLSALIIVTGDEEKNISA